MSVWLQLCTHSSQKSRTWGGGQVSAPWVRGEASVNATCAWPFKQVKTTSISHPRALSALPYRAVHMPTQPGHRDRVWLRILGTPRLSVVASIKDPRALALPLVIRDCHCLVRPLEAPAGQFLSLGRGFRPTCCDLPAVITETSPKNGLWS